MFPFVAALLLQEADIMKFAIRDAYPMLNLFATNQRVADVLVLLPVCSMFDPT